MRKKEISIRIKCADCGRTFSYVKTANVVKKFCDDCCRQHNVKSKRRNYLNMLRYREAEVQRKQEIRYFLNKEMPKTSPVLLSGFLDALQRVA